MFPPLPFGYVNFLISSDNVREQHVHAAISEAKLKAKKAENAIKKLQKDASEEEIELGWIQYASKTVREEAAYARIHAVLLTAIYIEGIVNALGVYVSGEEFFKSHIERCPIESKLAISFALMGKGCIQKNHPALADIRNLFDRRNQIAHRKTKEFNPDSLPAQLRNIKANNDIETCSKTLASFKKLLLEVDQMAANMAGISDDENNI